MSEPLEQWCHGMAECFHCGKGWPAVWPLGADALECPSCGSVDTDRDPGGDEEEVTRGR